ncbi:TPA: hypothetical protein ACVOYK_004500 [Vibrio diabolicus]
MVQFSSPVRQSVAGAEVLIWDHIFTPEFVVALYKMLNNAEYDSLPEGDTYRSWVCPFEANDFSEHELFTTFAELMCTQHKKLVSPRCLAAKALIMTFGDFVAVEQATKAPEGALTVLYYANAEWHSEWAAETILFSEDESASLAIAPKPGRMAVFPASLKRRLGVPSRVTHHSSLIVQFEGAL